MSEKLQNYIIYNPNYPAVPDGQFPAIVKSLKGNYGEVIATGSMALIDYIRGSVAKGDLRADTIRFGFSKGMTDVDKMGRYLNYDVVPDSPTEIALEWIIMGVP